MESIVIGKTEQEQEQEQTYINFFHPLCKNVVTPRSGQFFFGSSAPDDLIQNLGETIYDEGLGKEAKQGAVLVYYKNLSDFDPK